jgi:hypothetical protein
LLAIGPLGLMAGGPEDHFTDTWSSPGSVDTG